MIALGLGPRIDQIDVGFGADPGQAGGVPDHRIRKTVVDLDPDHAAGERVDVHARNAEGLSVVLSVIGRLRLIVIMRHSHADLRHQSRRNDAVVIQSAAVRLLRARSHERAARAIAAGIAEQRSLKDHRTRES